MIGIDDVITLRNFGDDGLRGFLGGQRVKFYPFLLTIVQVCDLRSTALPESKEYSVLQ